MRYGTAALSLAALLLATPALASKPALLTPTFKDRDLAIAQAAHPVPPPTCTIAITGIADQRSSPALVGVIGKRAVQSPADAQAWVRAVLGGLAARGIAPVFDAPPGASPAAKVGLQMAWIDGSGETYAASVVVSVDVTTTDGRSLSRTYRGRSARTAYWSMGSDTMQSALDGAFADMLNKMAPDLKAFCAA